MIAKRGLIVMAILVSVVLIGAVLMPALRAPTRTVVAPVELTRAGSSLNNRAEDERKGSESPTSDGDASDGADPVPPASPVPAGDSSGPGNDDDDDSGPGSSDDNSGPGSDSSGGGSGDDGDGSGSGS